MAAPPVAALLSTGEDVSSGEQIFRQVNHFSRIGTMRLVSKAFKAMAMPA